MSEFELHQLLAHNRELISDTWYFFLTVHLAIFGIVHVANRRVRFHERLLLYAAYFGFLAVNYAAQADNYRDYIALTGQIAALSGNTADALAPSAAALWVTQGDNLLYVYGAAAALSVLIILFTSRARRDE